jgi:hypothetical protein
MGHERFNCNDDVRVVVDRDRNNCNDRFRQEAYCHDNRGWNRNRVEVDVVVIIDGDRGGCNRRGGNVYDYRQPGGYQYDYRPYVQPMPRQPNYYHQGPTYSRDDVSGGRGGYQASRERYNGGYSGGYNGGYSDMDRTGQVFDFALRGFDAWAGHDIARRYANNQGRQQQQYQPQYGDRRNYSHGWQR